VANALRGLGAIAILEGDYARARALDEEAYALWGALGDRQLAGGALRDLGIIAWYEGDSGKARALLEESLALTHALPHLIDLAWASLGLGWVTFAQGEYGPARTHFAACLRAAVEIDMKGTVIAAVEGLAAVASATGEPERALRLAGAAAALQEELGTAAWLPRWLVLPIDYLAPARQALGMEAAEAAWTAGRALALEQAIGEALAEAGEG
jgi:hypothetical protein